MLQLSGWWVVFTVQLASFLATCWLLLQWTYNKWYPHIYFFNPVQLIFFSNKFYCTGTTLKNIYKKAHLQFFQTTPCNFRNTPWDSRTRLSGSESRLHVCMCLLCLIYHLASALTKPLSGYGSALFVYVCLCVLHSPTFRLGLTEQIAWLLKRCWGLTVLPTLPHPPSGAPQMPRYSRRSCVHKPLPVDGMGGRRSDKHGPTLVSKLSRRSALFSALSLSQFNFYPSLSCSLLSTH